jgi:1-acyl-sn-glycerol-3-phosphate acyltransferase
VAVLGAADPHSASERVVVVAETRVSEAGFQATLRERIAELAVEVLGVPADDVVLAPPHAVLKTSSGKIRRAACRELYEQGRLGQGGSTGVAWQLARLWAQALARRLRHAWQDMPALLFAARAWAVFGVCALAGVAVALLPGQGRRKRWARALTRLGLRAAGLAPRIERARAGAAGAGVFVANHASYLDWLVLTAALPADACFVAKRELARHAPMRWLLGRMGVRFVERDDVQASVDDARRLVDAVKAGASLVYFPEGTLTRAAGVKPFHMGAFVAAAESGAMVVPVGVHGTRLALRDGSWRPQHVPIEVRLGEPMKAQAPGWAPSLQLRDEVRLAVSRLCGEAPVPLA